MARSEVNYIFDAATAFRAPGAAALTATGKVGEQPLDKLTAMPKGSRRGQLASEKYDVVIVVNEIVTAGGAGGPETYVFDVKTGNADAEVKVGEVAVNQPGQFVLKLDAGTIEKLDPAHETISLNLTVGGEAPSVKFAAWLA